MKKLLLSILIIGSSYLYANQINHIKFGIKSICNQVLIRTGYISCYNYKTKNPDWAAYMIDYKRIEKDNKREDNFKEDKEIPSQFRASLDDYKGSGYDRGHLVPNKIADFNKQSQKESFLLTNIVPQYPQYNRGIWKNLERKVRDLSREKGIINVFTGVIYNQNTKKIGRNRISVPSLFYKVIFSPQSDKMYAFLIPHKKKLDRYDYKKYQVTVDLIENLTDNDFFYKLDDEMEERLESTIFKL